jgi:sigma-70-like protein/bifunctional nuclease
MSEIVELQELGRRVRQAIAELPAGQRAAVALFYLADLSHAEVAAMLEVEPGAVKTRLHKARGRLRRLVEETFYAQVVVQARDGSNVVEARPSDAIALALEAGVPIRVSAQLMDQAAVTRAQLAEQKLVTRSARGQAAQIRERISQRRSNWSVSTLF